jgi:hypothetical protein
LTCLAVTESVDLTSIATSSPMIKSTSWFKAGMPFIPEAQLNLGLSSSSPREFCFGHSHIFPR